MGCARHVALPDPEARVAAGTRPSLVVVERDRGSCLAVPAEGDRNSCRTANRPPGVYASCSRRS